MSQEVLKGNRLLMFFDGAELSEFEILGELTKGIKYKHSYYPEWNLPRFDQDWNLLWPVAQKIGELTGAITLEAIFRNLTDHYGKLICNRCDLWEACVKFINHYNQTQKR